ncbi:hypothetical protein BMF94_6224 [Rhodotorula taiwanensis]|uniref:Uncharacterized protein n=1 Tax=Rhodotorula taiwanensis TaxID=741276 RepID=A0A2S5B203_9BASI|nr:hypothetical protein BMF94_6224 [Rhodotorula taiwanensis]
MDSVADFVKRAGNDALALNPPNANLNLTTHGSDWLWAVFCVMALSAIALLVLGHTTRPVGERAFHELGAALCATASIAYFALASDLGATPVLVEFLHGSQLVNGAYPYRQVWYARYIDWTITTPMLLLELLLTTGLPLSQLFIVIFMDLLMIETGLIGSLVVSRYKWGFFAFGCAAEIFIWWMLLVPARASAARLGSGYSKAYMLSASILSFLWLLYPIAWGLCEGGNVISVTSEMVFYGVLDVLAKPVFSFIHVFAISKLDYARLGLSSGKVSDGAHQGLLAGDNKHATPRASTATGVNDGVVGDGRGFHPAGNTAV